MAVQCTRMGYVCYVNNVTVCSQCLAFPFPMFTLAVGAEQDVHDTEHASFYFTCVVCSSVITLIEHSEASTTKHKIIMWRKTERLHEIEFKRNEWYTISHCAANLKYLFESWCCACKAAGYHSPEGEATGEKGPATEFEPVTYALTRSFSHTRYGISHTPLSPISHSCAVTVDSTSESVTKGEMGDKGA